jgi:hypothetical protein
LHNPSEKRGPTINPAKTARKVKNQVIDGFIKAPRVSASVKNPTARPKVLNQNSQMAKTIHAPAPARGLHNRAQKASTLMRGALKRPGDSLGAGIQHLTPGLNPQRELRARKITKHSRVDHFGSPMPSSSTDIKRPVVRGEVFSRVAPKPKTSAKSESTVALPSMITSASHQKLERMLDAALSQADAHKQALKYHAARHFWQRPGFLGKRRGLKLGLIFVVLLSAMLVLVWQKIPQVSAKIAGLRAHVDASVPAYKPEGYQLATPIKSQSGSVVIKYKTPSAGSGFDIAEQQSNMTSTSLAQTVVPQGSQVQTSHVDGNTVYIYGPNNDAAWVNNGILYTIKDRSQLSSDQIIKIVHSLN